MANRASNREIARNLSFVVLGMLMLSYASVPLYRLFCQVTGFGGTTQRARVISKPTLAQRFITVRFNTDTDPHLPWQFRPLQREVRVRVGDNTLVAFEARNLSDEPTRARATYNVTPFVAAKYFNKVQCFCFTDQYLAPHARATLPVSFFIDPEILDDPEAADVRNITLSYTFFSYESSNQSKF